MFNYSLVLGQARTSLNYWLIKTLGIGIRQYRHVCQAWGEQLGISDVGVVEDRDVGEMVRVVTCRLLVCDVTLMNYFLPPIGTYCQLPAGPHGEDGG